MREPSSSVELSSEDSAVFFLRNGQFSNYQHPSGPACWNHFSESGKHNFLVQPATSNIQNPPAEAVIETESPGSAHWTQSFEVPQGEYTLSVEVDAPGAAIGRISVPGCQQDVNGTTGWEEVTFDFRASGNSAVYLRSLGSGVIKFRRVDAGVRKLSCSAIPFAGGSALGEIVIGKEATGAEKFAAWELQVYVNKMTGLTPGLKGRDGTHPGRRIIIGSATGPALIDELSNLAPDSYRLTIDKDDNIILAGNTPRGTLYAVYHFLKIQGCGWYMPGDIGEVVPRRDFLFLPDADRIESPAYDVRGIAILSHMYDINGKYVDINIEDYLDWAARNGINAFQCMEYPRTSDFGEHRGCSLHQMLGHSWDLFLRDDHPQWWPLVDGVRTKLHPSGRPNQLCVSNNELRDWVVSKILEYFAANPSAYAYSLCANDYTCWCECPQCRALDADGGAGPWAKNESGFPELSMTDRTLDFVNEVAARVAAVYPDKKIQTYAYAATQKPPVVNTVHPNVLIKYTWHGAPVNRPITEMNYPINMATCEEITGWVNANAQDMALYDYGNFFHVDSPNFWYRHLTDYLKTFSEKWGFRYCLGEGDNTFLPSIIWYILRTRIYWDVDVDYKDEIYKISHEFYGPAGKSMYDYYMFMGQQELDSNIWKEDDGGMASLNLTDFSATVMEKGRTFLEKAFAEVSGNPVLEHRLAFARFGHAVMTVDVSRNEESLGESDRQAATNAFNLARRLVQTYDDIRLSAFGFGLLKALPLSLRGKSLYDLPLEWCFRTDPRDVGLAEQWYRSPVAAETCRPISIDKDWTSQGYDYHGAAWYSVSFRIGAEDSRQNEFRTTDGTLALVFGAIDGIADIFMDGNSIGEQKEEPYAMWDKTFSIPLPGDFDPRIEHTLVVRVQKRSQGAGIWKPVVISKEEYNWTTDNESAGSSANS